MLPATTFRSSRYSTSFSCLCLPFDEECCIRRLPTDPGLTSRGIAKFLLNAFVEFLRNGNLPRQSTWTSYPCGQYQQPRSRQCVSCFLSKRHIDYNAQQKSIFIRFRVMGGHIFCRCMFSRQTFNLSRIFSRGRTAGDKHSKRPRYNRRPGN